MNIAILLLIKEPCLIEARHYIVMGLEPSRR
jgi:hypothetical protein